MNTLLLKFLASVNPLSLRVAAEVAGDMLADHHAVDVETTQPVPAPEPEVFARWTATLHDDAPRPVNRMYVTDYGFTSVDVAAEDRVLAELEALYADHNPWDAAFALFAEEAS